MNARMYQVFQTFRDNIASPRQKDVKGVLFAGLTIWKGLGI